MQRGAIQPDAKGFWSSLLRCGIVACATALRFRQGAGKEALGRILRPAPYRARPSSGRRDDPVDGCCGKAVKRAKATTMDGIIGARGCPVVAPGRKAKLRAQSRAPIRRASAGMSRKTVEDQRGGGGKGGGSVKGGSGSVITRKRARARQDGTGAISGTIGFDHAKPGFLPVFDRCAGHASQAEHPRDHRGGGAPANRRGAGSACKHSVPIGIETLRWGVNR